MAHIEADMIFDHLRASNPRREHVVATIAPRIWALRPQPKNSEGIFDVEVEAQ
jgi:hypothetical protein